MQNVTFENPTHFSMEKEQLRSYWKSNVRYLIILCSLWFVFGLACPILFVDQLNTVSLGGIPLGFWFSTQGSMLFIVVLLFVYARLMNALDKKHGVEEE